MTLISMPSVVTANTPSEAQLLECYNPESSFFFSSPTRTLLAEGAYKIITEPIRTNRSECLADRIDLLIEASKRAGHDRFLVVGALPFDDTSPARLIIPKTIQSAGPLRSTTIIARPPLLLPDCQLSMFPEFNEYVHGVEQAVALIRTEALRKVVLSRMLEVTLSKPIDIQCLLKRLAQQNQNGYTFAFNLSVPYAELPGSNRDTPTMQPRTLIGASPELLVSRSGLEILVNPLAGSTMRSVDPEEDERRASALLASEKDRHEHAIVVDAIVAALQPFCRRLYVPAGPSLTHTQTMWHLASQIKGELADPSVSSLKLATVLHPTPAVCGYPTERARAVIKSLEPFSRGYFTGAVGYCDSNGNGEWAVTIRCADITDHSLRMYSGAGIVEGSDGEHEFRETSAKLRTMLNALGIDQLRDIMQ